MAFKKPGNEKAVKAFYELYYQPDQVNTFIKAEGFLPVTKSGVEAFAGDAKLKVYLDTLPNAQLTPTDDPTWDKVKLAVQQNLGGAMTGDPKAVLDKLQKTAETAELSATANGCSRCAYQADRTVRRPATAGVARRPRGSAHRHVHPLVALLWLAPALALILGVVLYPAVKLFDASRGEYSITGLRKGDAGWDNYAKVLEHPDLGTVLRNTVVWVVAVVPSRSSSALPWPSSS